VHRNPRVLASVRAVRLSADGRAIDEPLTVPVEGPLAVQINESVVAHLMRLPGHDAELALGFCLTEGYIAGFSDILGVEVCHAAEGRVVVRTREGVAARPPRLLTSACVGPRETAELRLPAPLTVEGPIADSETLLSLPAKMRRWQEVRRAAGAVHAAAILTGEGQSVVVREDVGRHNAIDKVVGYCLYHGRPLGGAILVSTGRASSEMVLKAAAARVPVAASRSGPTSLGVELAEKLGVTLIGYLRPGRMTVYAHPKRVRTGA